MNYFRITIVIIFLLFSQAVLSQTIYYSLNGTTNPNDLNSWTQDPTGSTLIFPPANFNNINDTFIIDEETMSLTANWIVGGEVRVYGSLQNPDRHQFQAYTFSIYENSSYMFFGSAGVSKVKFLIIGPNGYLQTGNSYGGNSFQIDSLCTVDGSLYITNPMVGTGNFFLNDGGTLQIVNGEISISGNTGHIRLTGIRFYSKNANYKFISNVGTYSTGNALPDTVASLSLDNGEDSNTSLTSSVTVNGAFTSGGAWGGSNLNSYILLNSNTITCLGPIDIIGYVAITGDDQSGILLKGNDTTSYLLRAMTVGTLEIDRNAIINMLRNITVTNNLKLIKGIIRTGNKVLQLGVSAEGTIQQVGGRIVGTFASIKDNINTNPLLFPVGTLENNRFVTITYSEPPAVGGLIKILHSDSTGITPIPPLNDSDFTINFRTNMYWQITPVLVSGGIFNIAIDVSGEPLLDPLKLRLFLSDSSNTIFYTKGVHVYGTGNVVRRDSLSGPDAYGRFYAGGDSLDIPVELTSFTGNVSERNVILNWITATETNNKGFDIERLKDYSINKLQNWEKIGFIDGNGTTTEAHSYNYIDKNPVYGKYTYRLKQIDFNGSYKYSKELVINLTAPIKFSLEQNYPNPFNPATKIKYSVPFFSHISIKVFDVLGNEIKTLVNEEKPAGTYEVKFNGSNLPGGVYIYHLRAGNYSDSKKLILLK